MTAARPKAPLIGIADLDESKARSQVGALCWRLSEGKLQVLLVTSRETGRWVIPKGWPQSKKSAADSAGSEAWEEAGAKGRVTDGALGVYAYHKVLGPERGIPCVVSVFPMQVKSLARDYPEHGQRKRRWFAPKKAAQKVDEPELKEILKAFAPGEPDT